MANQGIITLNTNLTDADSQVPSVVDFDLAFQAVNTNLLGWAEVRANQLTYDGSNNVSQMNDLSGNGNHFTEPSTAQQPVYVPDIINGKGALYSDGSGKSLEWGGSLPTSADFTKVVLFRMTGGSGSTRTIFGTNTAERAQLYMGPADTVASRIGDTTQSNLNHSENVQDVWTLVIQSWDQSTETQSVSINGGTPETTTTAGAYTDQATNYLFAVTDAGSTDMVGYIASAQVWNLDLHDGANSDKLDLVKAYYQSIYGLTIA